MSVLLTLSLGITGCASRQIDYPVAHECVKPPLRGDTWADVAILSVEQASAIDVCNIRNGTDTYNGASKKKPATSVRVPSPDECWALGVKTNRDAVVTGTIVEARVVDAAGIQKYCMESKVGTTIGCTMKYAPHTYKIYYYNEVWVKNHEACHAYYEEADHTLEYLSTRAHK